MKSPKSLRRKSTRRMKSKRSMGSDDEEQQAPI